MKKNIFKNLFWTSKFAIVVFAAFVVGIVVNIYRLELFGVVPGNAANNFSFNIGFFMPYNLIILISCLVIITVTFIKWNKYPKIKNRIFSLGLTIPIIILWILQLIWVLRL